MVEKKKICMKKSNFKKLNLSSKILLSSYIFHDDIFQPNLK